MICELEKDILNRSYDIILTSDDGTEAYTIEITAHRVKEEECFPHSPLKIKFATPMFKALAQMLQKNGFLTESPTLTELKATKIHLNDMRVLAMNSVEWGENMPLKPNKEI